MIPVYPWTILATLFALAVYFYACLRVGRARAQYGVAAPATTGDPAFERAFRAHQNMLEWTPLFLPPLWLFAVLVSDLWAGALGALWALARLAYILAYNASAERRGRPFVAQALVCALLWLGSLFGVLRILWLIYS